MKRRIIITIIIIELSLFSIASGAWAKCTCVCMNGKNQPVCTSALDLLPNCPPKVCPIKSSSTKTIKPPTMSPIVTKKCWMEQVYNPDTQRYELKKVCH